ncbi:hypothetical protein HZA45_02100 [Candidatus Peregrinibacteria bacterium]|nr:hypothetical protein [Candidatus Peregrinibacteria bacterium]
MSWLISSTIGDPVIVAYTGIGIAATIVYFIVDRYYAPRHPQRRRRHS